MSVTDATPAPMGDALEARCDSPGILLALLGQEAMRKLREVHTGDGMSPRGFRLLALLHDHGAMRQSDLGRSIGADPSVLVTLLNPLEDQGLLSRERDPADRRCHVVGLTQSGKAKLERARQAQRRAEDELFANLDDGQRADLRDLLLAVRAGQGATACATGGSAA